MSNPRLHLFSLRTAHEHGGVLPLMHELRHRLFIERECYEVQAFDGMEFDEFDTPRACYALVTWRGRGIGCWRACAADRPTLTARIAPEVKIPPDPRIWDLSRWGIEPALPRAVNRQVSGLLVRAFVEQAVRFDLKAAIMVANPLYLKTLLPGTTIDELSETKVYGKRRAAVLRFAFTPTNLNAARSRSIELGAEESMIYEAGGGE